MIASFGLHDGWHPSYFPADRLAENWPRLDVWMLHQCGGLVEGQTTTLQWGQIPCRLSARTVDVLVDGTSVSVVWDTPMEGVARPWFVCPACGRRCRLVYLCDPIACRKCLRLDYASRHLYRRTPAVHRVARLRRKLGADPRPFAPLPPRRPGRSRAYHEKLVAMIHDEEMKLAEHLGGIIHDLKRRIRVRKERGKW
jgi:hypothetical protein